MLQILQRCLARKAYGIDISPRVSPLRVKIKVSRYTLLYRAGRSPPTSYPDYAFDAVTAFETVTSGNLQHALRKWRGVKARWIVSICCE
ncbi:MAG: hypothetical protein ACLRTD_26775 [Bacteroides sp.]